MENFQFVRNDYLWVIMDVRRTVYVVHCTSYIVRRTLYVVHCTSYIVRRILYVYDCGYRSMEGHYYKIY